MNTNDMPIGYTRDTFAGWQPVSIKSFRSMRQGKPVRRFRLSAAKGGSIGIRNNSFATPAAAAGCFKALTKRGWASFSLRAPMVLRASK